MSALGVCSSLQAPLGPQLEQRGVFLLQALLRRRLGRMMQRSGHLVSNWISGEAQER